MIKQIKNVCKIIVITAEIGCFTWVKKILIIREKRIIKVFIQEIVLNWKFELWKFKIIYLFFLKL